MKWKGFIPLFFVINVRISMMKFLNLVYAQMFSLKEKACSFIKEQQEGATMVEYAIMVALIAVVSIVTIRALGVQVNSVFGNVNTYCNWGHEILS